MLVVACKSGRQISFHTGNILKRVWTISKRLDIR
jgi:hypothetical protein